MDICSLTHVHRHKTSLAITSQQDIFTGWWGKSVFCDLICSHWRVWHGIGNLGKVQISVSRTMGAESLPFVSSFLHSEQKQDTFLPVAQTAGDTDTQSIVQPPPLVPPWNLHCAWWMMRYAYVGSFSESTCFCRYTKLRMICMVVRARKSRPCHVVLLS